MFELTKKVAIITGAGRGIGAACAINLAKFGADVVLVSRTKNELEQIAKQIKMNYNVQTLIQVCDIINIQEIKKVVKNTLERFGKIDILINNAGINQNAKISNITIKDWDHVIGINLKGTFLLTKEIIPTMIKNKYGRIINISSVAGQTGCLLYGGIHYTSSKAGQMGFTRQLAKEVSEFGITVNCIAPGMIKTKMWSDSHSDKQKKLVENIPCKRFGKPDEVASLACFLSSQEAGYITGEVININGGVYMN